MCSSRMWINLISFVWLATALTSSVSAYDVDIFRFGGPLKEANAIGVKWPEIRRVSRVVVVFPSNGAPLPSLDTIKVQYWHSVWTGEALRRSGDMDAGKAGWTAIDDWFNGAWKTADTSGHLDGRKAVFTFNASDQKEYPDLTGIGVTYRPTLKIRIVLSEPLPGVEALRVYTDSIWRESQFAVKFEGRRECSDPIEVYNGRLLNRRAAVEGEACVLRLNVEYAFNPEDLEADRTIVTVRSAHPFSFAVDEVEEGRRILVEDFGVLVTRASDPITISEQRRTLSELRLKTVYDRIEDHPEQTLSNAWNDMPLKRPYAFVLGCEGARQRFQLNARGELWVPTPPLKQGEPDKGLLYEFGLPESRFAERSISEGYVPIVTTRWIVGDLLYEQEAFADSLAGELNSGTPLQADDPIFAFVKFHILNFSSEPQTATLRLATAARGYTSKEKKEFEVLHLKDDMVYGSSKGMDVFRFLVNSQGSEWLTSSNGGQLLYRSEIAGHQESTLFLKIPFIPLTDQRQIGQLRSLNPEKERSEVSRYWKGRVAQGTQIQTPEPWLNDFYKAHLIHLLINNEREIGSDRYVARVGSFDYGAFGNESTMAISDLDRRGYSKEAERSLELFLHYQGTVPLPGNFTTMRGILYGAGGYEAGAYNQHHGWILWGLAEHYWYTRDRAWMQRVAPQLVEACRWLINERKGTQKRDAQGNPVPEYGLLPAGSLEDVTDFWYWLSTNCFSWWGLNNASRALRDFGHPEGESLFRESESYREDISRAFREAMTRSPVVALRDGTFVPHFPSEVYTRGRSVGWIREVLEGAIMLIVTRLLDPNSREAEWILKDYEDNLYISDKYGYGIPNFDQFWFSRGGFSLQPNLLHGPLPYLYRDQIEHYVRAYFNPFAATFDPTLRMLCEHPLPELGYFAGDPFKTSDESQSAYWLRLMFVTELGSTLHLGRALPRDWLRDGETLRIQDASTYFGKLSYEIHSQVRVGRISMSLDPPTRNTPSRILVRFRHPEAKPMRRVTVNSSVWRNFDGEKGDIQLPGDLKGHTEIVAEY